MVHIWSGVARRRGASVGPLTMAPAPIRSYFDVTPDSPRDAFVREARRHPFFELISATAV